MPSSTQPLFAGRNFKFDRLLAVDFVSKTVCPAGSAMPVVKNSQFSPRGCQLSFVAAGRGSRAIRPAGETAQTPLEISTLSALPTSFAHTGLAYDISKTAVFSGDVNLCFNLPALVGERFPRLRILHFENGVSAF